MKPETEGKLKMAHIYCDQENKSTEFMLQYMQDIAGVDLDCVLNYLSKVADKKETHNPHNV